MAQDEHRMVFDIRGRRRHVVKFVYAILAILMAASLFLVTGVLNPNTLFGSGSSGESAAATFEKQAEAIEAKLVKTPGEEALMANLTRARINAANSMISNEEGQSQAGVEKIKHQLALASEGWSNYVDVVSEPSAGLAIQVAPALFQLAEVSSSGEESLENVKAATEAEQIVAEQRKDLNSWSTLAIYALFAQNYKLAEKAKEEAVKLAGTKFERESFENKYDEVEKNAKEFGKRLKLEKASKATQGGGGGKESLENPIQGLGGATLGG
jgi:cytochrome c-type biogenesis protein CcmH/NrfG